MEGDGNSELVAMLVSRWPPSAATSPKGQLRVALASAAKAAAAAWPEVRISSERFVGYLAERADSALPPLEAVAGLHIADLYLACGCASGDPAATGSFLARYGPPLRAAVARIDAAPAFVDDLMDELRTALLNSEAGPTGREGKIAQYRGRVALAAWLEASGTRLALIRKGGAKPFDDLAEVAAQERSGFPPDHLRLRYPNGLGQPITDGTNAALASLSTSLRDLLRSHLIEGHSLRKLSHIRGVNVNTIAREFAAARATLHQHILAALQGRTGLAPEDVVAVVGALFTRVNLGITATLKASRASRPLR